MNESPLLESVQAEHCQSSTTAPSTKLTFASQRNEHTSAVASRITSYPSSPQTAMIDIFDCHVYDENVADAKYFCALVQVSSESIRIYHKDEKEGGGSSGKKVALFPYLNRPNLGLVHEVSYRGVQLLQRYRNEFTFRGVRAPVTVYLHERGDTDRLRRLLSLICSVKGSSSASSGPGLVHLQQVPVFQHVSEKQLAEVLDQLSMKLFRWSNQPLSGGSGGGSKSRLMMEFWINRHFCQEALGPVGAAGVAPDKWASFEAWQSDQRIVLQALEKISRLIRLHLKDYTASTTQRQLSQQLTNCSSSNYWHLSLPGAFHESLTSAAERICRQNEKEGQEEEELLQSTEEYPEEFDPFAEKTRTNVLQCNSPKANPVHKQVFYLVRTRLNKLLHKWNVFKKKI